MCIRDRQSTWGIYISLFLIADGIGCAFSNILRTIGAEGYALKCYLLTYSCGIVFAVLLVFTFKLIPQGIGLLIGLLAAVLSFVVCGMYKLWIVNLEEQCAEVKKNLAGSIARSAMASHLHI
eukprot:TRINITY_DN18769_c0_g1_i1.p1 TRINITY_DN18769_c0_g1~~TRINITY_DN18769_c0_g1_i1.p1  ORF type:complete len:122 (-),score=22.00 TRINITY_DN18769_c0_g1_i1:86-451(-)